MAHVWLVHLSYLDVLCTAAWSSVVETCLGGWVGGWEGGASLARALCRPSSGGPPSARPVSSCLELAGMCAMRVEQGQAELGD